METLITIMTITSASIAILMLMSILNKGEVKPHRSVAEMLKGTPEEDARIKRMVDENLAWCRSPERKRQIELQAQYDFYNRGN